MLVLGLVFFQTVAHAEILSGTVTNIDASSQKLTLHRADNNKDVTIHVKDKNAIDSLKAGSQITLDANKRMWGGWETQSVDASAASAPSSDLSAANASNQASPDMNSAKNANRNSASDSSPSYSASENQNTSANASTPASASSSASENASGTTANTSSTSKY